MHVVEQHQHGVDALFDLDRAGQNPVGHAGEDMSPPRIVGRVENDGLPGRLQEAEKTAAHLGQNPFEIVGVLAQENRVLAQSVRRPHEHHYVGTHVLRRRLQQRAQLVRVLPRPCRQVHVR